VRYLVKRRTIPAMMQVSCGDARFEELVRAVKLSQRKETLAHGGVKEEDEWVKFCNARGTNSIDPSKHDKDFLQLYLDTKGIQVPDAPRAPEGTAQHEEFLHEHSGLVNDVKMAQRSSIQNNRVWQSLCDEAGSNRNPKVFGKAFLKAYLSRVQASAEDDKVRKRGSNEAGRGGSLSHSTPRKRRRRSQPRRQGVSGRQSRSGKDSDSDSKRPHNSSYPRVDLKD